MSCPVLPTAQTALKIIKTNFYIGPFVIKRNLRFIISLFYLLSYFFFILYLQAYSGIFR
nr:MAG TPA: hypothetical protein [Herelleviridae sp.]